MHWGTSGHISLSLGHIRIESVSLRGSLVRPGSHALLRRHCVGITRRIVMHRGARWKSLLHLGRVACYMTDVLTRVKYFM